MEGAKWHPVKDIPPEGVDLRTIYLWCEPEKEPQLVRGSAIYSRGSYRNVDGGCLDTPSWWAIAPAR